MILRQVFRVGYSETHQPDNSFMHSGIIVM